MKLGIKIILAVVVVGGLVYVGDRINFWWRQHWHGPIASVQDLPPLDRAAWPKQPAAWSNETREVEVATPAGLRRVTLPYSINSLGMKLVRIEPGSFRMGQSAALTRDTGPARPVGGSMFVEHDARLTKPCFIAAFETTNQQFEQFDSAHARPQFQRGADGDRHPAQPVTWRRAQEFCRWLSAKEGRLYRLPTEAEWEYACRAGTTNRLYWGDNVDDRTKANLGGMGGRDDTATAGADGFPFTAPVGSFPPNPWGLYDMIGNAREWTADWYAPQSAAPLVDPTGPSTGHCRVMKGASYTSRLHGASCGWRDGDAPHDIKDPCGFRVVCEVE
jgi:formylglycine-generating enzyme required for sulfatase activity